MKKLEIRILVPLLVLGLAFGNVHAQTGRSTSTKEQMDLSLAGAVDYALKNKPAIQSATLDEQIAREKVSELKSIGLPQVNGSVSFQYFPVIPTSVIPNFGALFSPTPDPNAPAYIGVKFGTAYQLTAGLNAQWLVFDAGFLVGLRAAKVYVSLAHKNIERNKIDVASAVTKAYYTVLVNSARSNLIIANVSRLERLRTETSALNKEGFVEKIDVDRLTVTLTNLQTQQQNIQSLVDVSYALLKFQMGLPLSTEVRLTDSIKDQAFKPALEDESDYTKRIEYGILSQQKRLNEIDIKRYKASYLPSLILIGSAGYSAPRTEFNYFDFTQKFFPTVFYGFNLNVPIFDGFQKRSLIQASRLILQKTNLDLQNLQQAVDLENTSSRIVYNNAFRAVQAQQGNLALAQEIIRVARIKYTEGVGSSLEVINAETDLREAETNYFSSLYDLLIAQTDLAKARGTLL